MSYNYQKALTAGAKPQAVAEFLAQQQGFDLNRAVNEGGYTYEELLPQLSVNYVRPQPTTREKRDIEEVTNKSYFENVGDLISKRSGNITALLDDREQDIVDQKLWKDVLRPSWRIAGQFAGGATDMIATSIASAFKLIAPKSAEEFVGQKGKEILESELGQQGLEALEDGMESYMGWKEKHPELARDFESGLNIAGLLMFVKGGKPAPAAVTSSVPSTLGSNLRAGMSKTATYTKDTVLGATKQTIKGTAVGGTERFFTKQANKIRQKTANLRQKKHDDFLQNLTTPFQSKKVKTEQVTRTSTTDDFWQTSNVEPSPRQLREMASIRDIPGVSANKTIQANYNAIKKYNKEHNDLLMEDLRNSGIVVPKSQFKGTIHKAQDLIRGEKTLQGKKVTKVVDEMLAKADELLDNSPGTLDGMYEARIAFDRWILDQNPNLFKGEVENARTIAAKHIHDSWNSEINRLARMKKGGKEINFGDRLYKEHNMFNALNTIQTNAQGEASTLFGRTLDRIGSIIGTKNELVQAAAVPLGLTSLAALQIAAPIVQPVVLGGIVLYGGGRILMSPKARDSFANLFAGIDAALAKTTDATIKAELTQAKEYFLDVVNQAEIMEDWDQLEQNDIQTDKDE